MNKPTESSPWADDKLKRQEAANFLTSYMTKRFGQQAASAGDSFVLNLNCGWGFGKTYFLKNWRQDLEIAHHPVIYFDAWRNDFSDEPLLGFIAELDAGLKQIFQKDTKAKAQVRKLIDSGKRLVKPALPVLLAALVKKSTGLTKDELSDIISAAGIGDPENSGDEANDDGLPDTLSKAVELAAKDALKQHVTMQRSMAEFQTNIGKIVDSVGKSKEYKLPIFIMVDELDRCRPLYAIELLETIKHLFGVAGVCFVVATDTRQLASSVKAVYGSDFEAELYLKRFFDQEYILPDPDYEAFADFLFSQLPANGAKLFSPFADTNNQPTSWPAFYFSALARACQLDLRGQLQVFHSFQAICTILPENSRLHLPLIIFLLMLRQTSPKGFDDLWRDPKETADLRPFTFAAKPALIDYMENDRGGSSRKEYSLGDVIKTYLRLLTMDRQGLLDEFNRVRHGYIEAILQDIINTQWSKTQGKGNVLRNYFDLVRQAGQLT